MSDVTSNASAAIGPTALTPPDVRASRVATLLAWGVLVTLLVLPLTVGNFIGDIAIVLGLVSLFFVDREGYGEVLRMPHIWLLVGSFLLLAMAAAAFGGATTESLVAFDFVPFLLAIPICGVFRRALISRPEMKLPLLSLAGTAIGLCVVLGELIFLHTPRPGGWLYNPIYFADLAVTLGFIAAAGLMDSSWRWWPVFAAGPVLGVATGILSGTRSSLFIAAADLIAFVVLALLRRRAGRPGLVALLAVAMVLAGMLLVAPRIGMGRVLDLGQIADLPTAGDTVADAPFGYRLEQSSAALRAFADAPIFGHGWRHQMASALQYMPAEARQTAVGWEYIHNEFLNLVVGMGVFGGIAWLLLAAYPPVALLWARRRGNLSPATSYMVLVAWLGILLGGLTDVLFRQELTKSFYPFIPNAILMLTWRPGRPVVQT